MAIETYVPDDDWQDFSEGHEFPEKKPPSIGYDPRIEDIYRYSFDVDGLLCSDSQRVQYEGEGTYDQWIASLGSCHGAMLVYDVTRRSTMESLPKHMADWLRVKDDEHAPFIVVAAKADLRLSDLNVTSLEEAKRLTQHRAYSYVECSVRDRSTDKAFHAQAELVRAIRAHARGEYPAPPVEKKDRKVPCVLQ